MKVDLSAKNPFSTYQSNFAANFSFGKAYDDWVCDTMLPALCNHGSDGTKQALADIGAGPCYWASLFLQKASGCSITAVDPSKDLIGPQADQVIAENPEIEARLARKCETVQDFASRCSNPRNSERFDCIYFMQSAHYVGHHEFKDVIKSLSAALNPGGRIVIQARNMTSSWYPWAFPNEWIGQVEKALHATDMFHRADRYASVLSEMPNTFVDVQTHEAVTQVDVPCEGYWQRLEDRWIPTFMSEDIIDAHLHRVGIDAMKTRFMKNQCDMVSWVEKFAVVTAHV